MLLSRDGLVASTFRSRDGLVPSTFRSRDALVASTFRWKAINSGLRQFGFRIPDRGGVCTIA